MHRLTPFFAFLFAIPMVALALDFSGSHLPYSDVRDGTPEAAAISLLTAEGVLEGNPDGTFRPARTLNRAEFLKIVLESAPMIGVNSGDSADCFPDVKTDDWFSRYVCLAKANGIIEGYPDGTFKPTQNVNYAEALKMLVELYGYTLPEPAPNERWAWYTGYIKAAEEHDVTFGDVDPARELKRGEMARLAAAFLAADEGMLDAYRAAERGEVVLSSSSSSSLSSSSSSVSSSGSLSSSVRSSSSSSASAMAQLPVQSSFLLLGRTSPALAGGVMQDRGEAQVITFVRVRLFQEVTSIQTVELVKADGTVLTTMNRKNVTSDAQYRRTYEAQLTTLTGPEIPAGAQTIFVRAQVRALNDGGVSNQLLQVASIEVTTYGKTSSQTFSNTMNGPYAVHQTSLGQITAVAAVGPVSGALSSGTGKLLGAFRFSGSTISGSVLTLQELIFTVDNIGATTLSNYRLRANDTWHDCTIGQAGVSCSQLGGAIANAVMTGLPVELYADVTTAASTAPQTVQVSLSQAGTTMSAGSVTWSDGIGTFKWLPLAPPLAKGTLLTK